jgi:transposase InsO family protein
MIGKDDTFTQLNGGRKKEKPFTHEISIHDKEGNAIRASALFDGGAMVGAISLGIWHHIKGKLSSWGPSTTRLRMANGVIILSHARWEGTVEIEGIRNRVTMEVFDSQGAWEVLFGKPLLNKFRAIHDFHEDRVSIRSILPPIKAVLENTKAREETSRREKPPPSPKLGQAKDAHVLTEAPNLFTRNSDPFKPERVAEIQRVIQMGSDISEDEERQVRDIIAEFADCFALSISEVNAVPGYKHKLEIPSDAILPTKIPLRTQNPTKRKYLNKQVDDMAAAEIIRPIHPRDVKCVSPTVLAQKEHDGGGLTIDELLHKLNDQCIAHGLDPIPNLPPRPDSGDLEDRTSQPAKYRICQNFDEVNKVTKIAPVLQGDIRAKQLRLSGHRYLHIFDFAAGFYHIAVDEDSQPYLTFFVEGRGYWAYQRMPFGITGAPAEFGNMMAAKTHDLTADGTFELFVDDGGSASDSFEEGIKKLRIILERVRKEKLSLSPSKLRLFMTRAVFAGSVVGPDGVSPDPAKLSAVVDWPIPADASHLEGFLGLTAYFRDLIQGYARIEAPLRNILKGVGTPAGAKKSLYQRMMKAYKLQSIWTEEHTRTFLKLKLILVSQPVLVAPRFDGTPFILTTDGCVDAFAGVLCQKVNTTLPGGQTVLRRHPIAFASKRTSNSERKYKPYLLEFAALKFCFDKFSDTLYGFPVEIETDCQALRDVLISEKLPLAHARWRDGILAYRITDVRHIPGVTNIADGLSRQYENSPRLPGDGSEWTVSPDWETREGITNDVFGVDPTPTMVQIQPRQAELRRRFEGEPLYLQVIDALEEIDGPWTLRSRIRAKHRASQYMIDDGKLWFIAGGTGVRARPRRECIPRAEAIIRAREQHELGGHWHRDSVKIALLDRYHSPGLDESIVKAITDCARCKNFGGAHLNALLQPITRRHPFELLVGDYLSMPMGKGGYHTVGLYLDVASQHVWGYKLKTHGSAKTTVRSLDDICHNFAPPEAFQTDGGKHFDNQDVDATCGRWGTDHIITAAYSPWVNGLVEGTNKLLLYVLARLCAPELGEDGWKSMVQEHLPRNWPDHFEEAIRILNWRILPALKFSPKELLLGLVINTTPTPTELRTLPFTAENAETHMTYAAQQRLDAHREAVEHAILRKAAFDRKLTKTQGGPVAFEQGELVQVFRSDLTTTVSNDRKLIPRWSEPRRIKEQILNAYKLEDLEGREIPGVFSARRLRKFIAREGTELARREEEHKHQGWKSGRGEDNGTAEERMIDEQEGPEGGTGDYSRNEEDPGDEEDMAGDRREGSDEEHRIEDEEDSEHRIREDGDEEDNIEEEEEGLTIAQRLVAQKLIARKAARTQP